MIVTDLPGGMLQVDVTCRRCKKVNTLYVPNYLYKEWERGEGAPELIRTQTCEEGLCVGIPSTTRRGRRGRS